MSAGRADTDAALPADAARQRRALRVRYRQRCRTARAEMGRARGRGQPAGLLALLPGKTAYAMSKVAMSVLTKGLAMDWERRWAGAGVAVRDACGRRPRLSRRRRRIRRRTGRSCGPQSVCHASRKKNLTIVGHLFRRGSGDSGGACRRGQRCAAARRGLSADQGARDRLLSKYALVLEARCRGVSCRRRCRT